MGAQVKDCGLAGPLLEPRNLLGTQILPSHPIHVSSCPSPHPAIGSVGSPALARNRALHRTGALLRLPPPRRSGLNYPPCRLDRHAPLRQTPPDGCASHALQVVVDLTDAAGCFRQLQHSIFCPLVPSIAAPRSVTTPSAALALPHPDGAGHFQVAA